LHLSVRLELYDIAEYVLEKKKEERKFINRKDKFGLTALHMAIAKRDVRMIKLLLEYKASIRIKDN
jgi:ankyrin repeat protein